MPLTATAANSTTVPPILFVGAGRIGMPILQRLIARGLDVHVSDASPDALAGLQRGGVLVYQPGAISRLTYSRVVLCLPDPAAATAIIMRWIEHGLPEAAIVADITTMSPGTARHHAALVAAAGGDYLDVPVSGGQRGAETGEMIVLAGGRAESFKTMLPIFRAMGSTVHHVGEVGTASQVKAVNQHVYLSYNLAFAHGLRLGRELGLPETVVIEMLTKGAAAHPLINDRLSMVMQSEFREGFLLKRCLKDLDCLELPAGQQSTAIDAHERLSSEIWDAVDAGLGDLDILALSRRS